MRKLPPFFSHKHRIVYSDIELCESLSEIKHPSVREVLKHLGVIDGLEIHYDGDLPSRSGLGSSSSFTVGLLLALNALKGKFSTRDSLIKEAIQIERGTLKEAGGWQDQVAVATGGLNCILFTKDTYYPSPVIMTDTNRRKFEDTP